jgi:hypothetical protein
MAQVAKLTIDNTKVAGDLTDFPVYVNLADLPSSFWDTVANGGGDIRVFKSDGTTELPREVVSCDTSTETGELHFKYTGTLSGSTDTEVQIHADGTSADYAVTDTYGRNNVWTGYKGVWHTQANSNDSTSGGFNGTDSNVSYVTGKIRNGAEFNGTNSQISLGNVGVSGSTARTISGWLKTDVVNTSLDAIFTYGAETNRNACKLFANVISNGDLYLGFFGRDYYTSGLLSTDTWYYFNAVYEGGTLSTSTVKIYLNATSRSLTQVGVSDGSADTTDSNYAIGYDKLVSGRVFDGILDEIRITNVALSANWITTEYNNQNSPSTFYTAEVPFITLNITDTISLSETSTYLRNRVSNITDNLNLTENISLLKVMFLNIVDTLHLDDLVSGVRDMLLTVTDALHITDSSNVKFKWTKQDKPTSTFTSQTKPTSIWTDQTKD